MYCNYCGKAIPDDANLCAYCGKNVGALAARRRIVRPRHGRKIGGVALAFSEYFELDVSLIRVIWVLLGILGFPFGIIAYIACWIVIPEGPELLPAAAPSGQTVQQT